MRNVPTSNIKYFYSLPRNTYIILYTFYGYYNGLLHSNSHNIFYSKDDKRATIDNTCRCLNVVQTFKWFQFGANFYWWIYIGGGTLQSRWRFYVSIFLSFDGHMPTTANLADFLCKTDRKYIISIRQFMLTYCWTLYVNVMMC